MAYGSMMTARRLGAWSAQPEARKLWSLSKRELIEIALHQATRLCDDPEEGSTGIQPEVAAVLDEHRTLRQNRLI